jgi:hypothetical protein
MSSSRSTVSNNIVSQMAAINAFHEQTYIDQLHIEYVYRYYHSECFSEQYEPEEKKKKKKTKSSQDEEEEEEELTVLEMREKGMNEIATRVTNVDLELKRVPALIEQQHFVQLLNDVRYYPLMDTREQSETGFVCLFSGKKRDNVDIWFSSPVDSSALVQKSVTYTLDRTFWAAIQGLHLLYNAEFYIRACVFHSTVHTRCDIKSELLILMLYENFNVAITRSKLFIHSLKQLL